MKGRPGWCSQHCGPGAEVRTIGEYEILKCRHHGRFQVFNQIDGIISINHTSKKDASSYIDKELSKCGGF